MTELRACRRQLGVTQSGLAELLGVPLNSLRMWDSGLRPTPARILGPAQAAAAEALRDREQLTLPELARELHVNVRTLQEAARTGRLEVSYTTRSAFGRPVRRATRAAVKVFLRAYYKRYTGQAPGVFAVPSPAPPNCQSRLRELRCRLKVSQSDLAELVGAANKAVVYQWESGKRLPSPVFWERVARLEVQATPCSSSSGNLPPAASPGAGAAIIR